MYEYQPMQPMSSVPYHTYVDQFSVLAMVSMQLEYYFSIDNLCKDVFLRKHMDSQGFVFLTFIADFKRIQALTKELEMIRFACQESEVIDIIKGEDGVDRIRRKEGWEKWVLGMDERDESVRNDGPTFHQRHQPLPRPQSMAPMVMQSPHPASPAFSPTATDPNFRSFANGPPLAMNGNGGHFHPETPLSAAVPDFAPGVLPVNGTPDPLEEETTFYDEDVANLKLVFATPKGGETSKSQPYHSPSSRTFSNGSIDSRSVTEGAQDDRQGRGLTNGSHLPAT
jgi:la-related protein 1